MAKKHKKNKAAHKDAKNVEVVEPVNQVSPIETPTPQPSKKQEIINTTVKIVSTFSDMINTWKNNKVKRYKKKLVITLSIIGTLVFIALIVLVALFATKTI